MELLIVLLIIFFFLDNWGHRMRNKYIQIELNDEYDALIEPDISYDTEFFKCKIDIGTIKIVNALTNESMELKHFLPNLRMELEYTTNKKFEEYVQDNFEDIMHEYADCDYIAESADKYRKDMYG